jgi:hypothetical protein
MGLILRRLKIFFSSGPQSQFYPDDPVAAFNSASSFL